MAKCEKCFLDLVFYPPLLSGACSNCGEVSLMASIGAEIPPLKKETYTESNSVSAVTGFFPFPFFETVKTLFFNPRKFFNQYLKYILSPGGLSAALAFAIVCQWIASLFTFLWNSVFKLFIERYMHDFIRISGKISEEDTGGGSLFVIQNMQSLKSRSFEMLFGAGAIVLSPFLTIIKLSVIATIIHLGVKLFFKNIPDRPQSFQTTMKILCFGTAASLLNVIPFIGMIAALVLGFVIEVAGFKEVYQTTGFRASVAVLFPGLLIMFFFVLMIAFAALIGFSFFSLLMK